MCRALVSEECQAQRDHCSGKPWNLEFAPGRVDSELSMGKPICSVDTSDDTDGWPDTAPWGICCATHSSAH
jgi:hypothetical protein